LRVSDKVQYDQVIDNITKNRSDMAKLQNQAATQKRVTKPSDDPVAASRVLSSRLEVQGNDQYQKSLDYARSFLEFTDQSLAELTEYLARVKELALSQANDASANHQTRRVTAAEVRQIFDQIVQVSNRKLGDRFVFGGYKTKTRPFDLAGNYRGDAGEILIQVDKGSFVAANLPGSKVFHGQSMSRDGIAHNTTDQPTTVEQLAEQKKNRQKQNEKTPPDSGPEVRGPAGQKSTETSGDSNLETPIDEGGINIFNVVKRVELALKTNDKQVIQDNLEALDRSLDQVVLARAQVGSRVMVLNNSMESLQKTQIDAQAVASSLEDVDIFEVVSDINRNESQLQATMQTSGKLLPRSLMDFLR
jgi:flagellar hook-associated protein 3 FlgL